MLFSMELLFCDVLRRYVSQNIDAITATLQLNRFDIEDSLCCMYLIERFSQLFRCEAALHFTYRIMPELQGLLKNNNRPRGYYV